MASAGSRRSCRGRRAAFSTRLGGVSEGAFESLNLGLLTDDERGGRARQPRAPRRRRSSATRDGVLFGLQVHGAELARRERRARPEPVHGRGRAPGRRSTAR